MGRPVQRAESMARTRSSHPQAGKGLPWLKNKEASGTGVPRSAGMSSGATQRLQTLQRHVGSREGRGMEPGSSPLTTHVLDTASGLPAQGLYLCLSRLEDRGQQWTELKKSCTDHDGRCPGLLPPGQMKAGTYKLSFDTKGYWQKRGQESFYPYVEVVFTITNETHKFHVPLLLSQWSYTTYRGS
uniref:Uncharacterized protein n=3 Tax=Rangifer tarandus platyrhynchus TaxID=3082113 RepID=A0ACB0E964_RANTA|nr:unnamed protein product [Rangifer tarandus platyrhynchus]